MFVLAELENKHIPVLPTTPNFYMDEYLQNNLTIPGYEDKDFNVVEDPEVMLMICIHATISQSFRNKYGKSVNATSGYRPELYNDVVLIEHGYSSEKDSDHKFIKSGALDTDVPATDQNISLWKAAVQEARHIFDLDINHSVSLYNWGMHLGFRIGKPARVRNAIK